MARYAKAVRHIVARFISKIKSKTCKLSELSKTEQN
jgi:hypothetical protein